VEDNTTNMKLSSQFCDRWNEPFPGKKPRNVYTETDLVHATLRPSKWIFTKGAFGTERAVAQMKRTNVSKREIPATTLFKPHKYALCKDYCQFSMKFYLQNTDGSITFGFKAKNSNI